MNSKVEKELDKKFKVTPRIYHFTEQVSPFRAITTAILPFSKFPPRYYSWREVAIIVKFDIEYVITHRKYDHSCELLKRLAKHNIKGVAVCVKRDQFSRQRGRIIAKGRLLKALKCGKTSY